MSDIQLYKKIESLEESPRTTNNKNERKFDYTKGFCKMSEDFNKPLDDFKDYM